MKQGRFSHKREAILETIRSTKTHPSAEWIYNKLKIKYKDLSLGTIYRNIALFKEQGLITSVENVGGHERLDGNTVPHAHFICLNCNEVIDIDSSLINTDFNNQLSEKYDFNIDYQKIIFYGKCSKCLKER